MSSPTSDPYAVLGVAKDATTAEIRSSYRKLVLKCHPDKIQDETKRNEAVDVFQKVQEAYELLSDDAKRAKYDNKAQYAEQKRAAATETPSAAPFAAPFRTTTYEYRGGKLYEERTFTRSYDDSEEEPRVSSRKYDPYERKSLSRDTDEKKKSKTESKKEASRSNKERVRESIRSSRSDRAKTRDKERRREQSEKHSRTAYVASDDSESDKTYERVKSSRPKATYESVREQKPYESPKYIYIEDNAYDYIQRQKAGIPEHVHERRPSAPFLSSHSVYYQTMDGDTARRSSARPARPSRGDSARSSVDHRDPYDGPEIRTSRKSPGIRVAASSRATAPRSQTSYPVRTVKEVPTLRRSETAPLSNMTSRRPEPVSRSSRTRERYDSGYSSPGTPEMYGTSPTKSSRFTVVEPDDYSQSHRVAMADTSRRHQSVSPSRRVSPVPIRATSRPAQLRAGRVESARVIPTMRRGSPPPLRRGSTREALFGEFRPEYHDMPPEKVRSSPRIRQEDVRYSPHKVLYQPTTVLAKGSYAC